jgi:hypothetical protein
VSAYILKSLISLREEITERLMQNTEFRALQSLQRSIDEVTELTRRDEEAAILERAASQARLSPASLVREFATAAAAAEEAAQAAVNQANISRVTPAHFATSKRVM